MNMGMKMKVVMFVSSIFSISCLTSSAAISMIIDPSTKELSFTGDASGTALDIGFGSFQVVSWNHEQVSGPNETLAIGASFDEMFTNRADIIVYENTTTMVTGLRLVFANTGATPIPTITANANKVSYAGMSANFVTILDNYSAGTFTQNQGTGYGNINFTNTVVPEPSSSSLLLATCILGLTMRHRSSHT